MKIYIVFDTDHKLILGVFKTLKSAEKCAYVDHKETFNTIAEKKLQD